MFVHGLRENYNTVPSPSPHSCSFVTDVASLALLGDASLPEMSYNRMLQEAAVFILAKPETRR